MQWFLIGLLAPFFWGITNFIDKFLIDKYYKGKLPVGAILLIFTGITFLFTPIFLIIAGGFNTLGNFSNLEILALVLSAMFYILALLPYMKALSYDDTSIIIPVFQLIPIFSLALGLLFLNEELSIRDIVLGMVIILGAVGISLDLTKKIVMPKTKMLLLMALSCLIYALANLLFKLGAENHDFWPSQVYVCIGYGVMFVVFFIFSRKARAQTLDLIARYKGKIVAIQIVNVTCDTLAKVAYNFALFSAPIFLASIVNSAQPVFVFFMGAILTIFVPKFIKEDLSKKVLLQKIFFIAVIFVASVMLNY